MRTYRNGKPANNPKSLSRGVIKRDSKEYKTVERASDPEEKFAKSIKAKLVDTDGDGFKDSFGKIHRSPAVGKGYYGRMFAPYVAPKSGGVVAGGGGGGGGVFAPPTIAPPVVNPPPGITPPTLFVNQYSVEFDGANEYVDFASDPNLEVKAISYWFNQATPKNTMIVSGLGGSAYRSHGGFGTDVDGKIRWNDGVYGGTSALNTFHYNIWNHFVAFYVPSGYVDTNGTTTNSGAGWAVYVNNNRVDITTSAGATTHGTVPLDTTDKFKIGTEGQRPGMYQFNGKVDEVALFTSPISASDVSDIYNNGTPVDLGTGGLNLSPAGYWRMGDNDGGVGTTITDQGSGGNDGTLTNGSTFSTSVPEYVFNQYSVSFDGTNQYMGSLPVPRNSGSWDTETPITLSAWVKINSFTSDAGIFGIGRQTVNGGYNPSFIGGHSGFHMTANGLYLFQSGQQHTLNGSFTGGKWYHMAWTWDGTDSAVYIDGSLNKTFIDDSNGFNTRMVVWAGGGGRWNGFSNCVVDEITFWDSALSSGDVTDLYNNGIPSDPTSLSPLVWYRMGDGTENGVGNEVFDMSGNARTVGFYGTDASGKLFNGATFSTDVPS